MVRRTEFELVNRACFLTSLYISCCIDLAEHCAELYVCMPVFTSALSRRAGKLRVREQDAAEIIAHRIYTKLYATSSIYVYMYTI